MRRVFLAFGFVIAATTAASTMPLAKLAQPSDVIAIHGCHQTWQHGQAGWHRHGSKCEFRRGVVDSTKRPVKPRKPSVRG